MQGEAYPFKLERNSLPDLVECLDNYRSTLKANLCIYYSAPNDEALADIIEAQAALAASYSGLIKATIYNGPDNDDYSTYSMGNREKIAVLHGMQQAEFTWRRSALNEISRKKLFSVEEDFFPDVLEEMIKRNPREDIEDIGLDKNGWSEIEIAKLEQSMDADIGNFVKYSSGRHRKICRSNKNKRYLAAGAISLIGSYALGIALSYLIEERHSH